jgi:amino acid adenylation domain-containing protein
MFINSKEEALLFSSYFLKQRDYWINKLPADIVFTSVLSGVARTPPETGEGNKAIRITCLTGNTFNQLLKLTKASDMSIFIVLLASLKVLIYRYTGKKDLLVVSPINKFKVTDQAINNFVMIYDRVNGDMTFKDLLLTIRQTVLEAYDNQDYPLEKLMEYLYDQAGEKSDKSGHHIVCGLNTLHSDKSRKKPGSKLLFWFEREETQLKCSISYDSLTYETNYIEQIYRHLRTILENAIQDVNVKVSGISFLSEPEKKTMLIHFNQTRVDHPTYKSFSVLFEDLVRQTPDRAAVVGIPAIQDKRRTDSTLKQGRSHNRNSQHPIARLTYGDLNERAHRLAAKLNEKGVKPDTITALMLESSIEMIIGIIAIIKAGGAYLPLDPGIPGSRIEYMLNDNKTAVMLTTGNLFKETEGSKDWKWQGEIIFLEGFPTFPPANTPSTPDFVSSENLVYVIYTSGTTGRPKGVLIKNENLLNYVHWFIKAVNLSGKDKSILTSSFAFDLGYTSIFPCLAKGSELHIVSRDIYLMPEFFLDYMNKNSISYIKITPSLFKTLIDEPGFSRENCHMLRLVVLGGEKINLADIQKARKVCRNLRVINHYGPTEATIGCIAQYIDFNEWETYKLSPTLGKPIHNERVYILDRNLRLIPVGVSGELCIAGAGLARGYLNRPELTAHKFVKFIYIKEESVYRTGDLARWTTRGRVEFLGRQDTQVKVRGFRIELGEIETQLRKYPGIEEAAVICRSDKSEEKYICTYIKSKANSGENPSILPELKSYLSQRLPDYMLPSFFILIDKIPLTPNGKIDSKALPAPEINPGENFIPPKNDLEEKLVRIWSEVLGIEKDKISMNSNFFDLGGHSLKAVMLAAKIHRELDIGISLGEIFKTPTIMGISSLINLIDWASTQKNAGNHPETEEIRL